MKKKTVEKIKNDSNPCNIRMIHGCEERQRFEVDIVHEAVLVDLADAEQVRRRETCGQLQQLIAEYQRAVVSVKS